MKLPIRNCTALPLTLFIEPYCDQYEIPAEGEAIVTLDSEAHSIDFHPENWVSLWIQGAGGAVVEVVSKAQNVVVDALFFVGGWLHQYGLEGEAAARDLADAVEREEHEAGYVRARFAAYRAFREGFLAKSAEVEPDIGVLPAWRGRATLAGAYLAGGLAAYFNHRTRLDPGLIELGEPPFDTDVARRKFEEADAALAPSGKG